jgi:hypothetical protein
MDKEYTDINKEAICICGIFAALRAGLGANFASQVASRIGCDSLLMVVSSVTEFAQTRSSAGGVVRAA